MIRFFPLAFLFLTLLISGVIAADIDTSGTSDDKTLYENINAIPALSYTSSALNSSFLLDIAAAVADCANVVVSGENVKAYTVFVPTNDALKEALLFFRQHAGGSEYGPTEEQQRLLLSQVTSTGKIDLDALRYTDNQKAKLRAAFLYSIIPGECSDADLNNPVQFMPTLLQPKINIQVTHDPQQAASKRKSQGLSRSTSSMKGVETGQLSDRTREILQSLPTDFSDEVKLGGDESQRLQIANLNAHGDLATIIRYESRGASYKNSSIKIEFPAHASPQRLQPPTASRPPSNPQSSQQLPDQGLSATSHRGFAESNTQAKTLIGRLESQEQRGLLQANVIRANIKSSNGMLHIIDRILIIPLNTTIHLNLAQLNHTLDAVSQSDTLKKQINERAQMTLFAPSEEAWKNFISRYQEITRQESSDDDDDNDQQPIRGKKAEPIKKTKQVKSPAPYQNLDSDDYSPSTNVLDVFTKEQLDAIMNAHTAFDVVLYSSAIGRYNPESDNSDLSTRSAIRSLAKTPSSDTIHLPVRRARQSGGSIIRTNDGNEHSVRKAARGFAVDDAFILNPNIMTKNGVVHVINQFLITPQQLIQMPIKRKQLIRQVRPATTVTTEQKKKIPTPLPQPVPGDRSVPAGQTCLNLTALSLLPTLKPQPPTPALDCPEGDQICYVLDITQACDADTAVQGDRPKVSGPEGGAGVGDISEGDPRLSGKCPPLLIGSSQSSRSYSRSRATKSFKLFATSQSAALAANVTDQTQLNYVARCYSPKTHVCVNNHFLCPINAASLCGNQCYDAAKFRCFTTFALCPASAPSLCFGACYHKNQYTCTVNGLQARQKDTDKRQP